MSERPTPETDAELHGINAVCKQDCKLNAMTSHARKLERQRDEARELCSELLDLLAYGLGQSGEPWSLDAMRQAAYAIHRAKQLGGPSEQRGA